LAPERQIEFQGNSGRGALKDHPEYLMAVRDNRLIISLVSSLMAFILTMSEFIQILLFNIYNNYINRVNLLTCQLAD